MSLLTGFGSFLQGATQEATTIRQEREAKEQQNLSLTMSILSNIIENPQITNPQLKQEAFDVSRDVLMQHLFPSQFKPTKGGKLAKLVEQFVGQNSEDSGSRLSGIIEGLGRGEGAGRGNATSPVGSLQQPMKPSVPMPTPPSMPTPGVTPAEPTGQLSMPPSPSQAGVGGPPMPPRTAAGFVDPILQAERDRQTVLAEQKDLATFQEGLKRETDRLRIEQEAQYSPDYTAPIISPDPQSQTGFSSELINKRNPQQSIKRPHVLDAEMESQLQALISSGMTRQQASRQIGERLSLQNEMTKAQTGLYRQQSAELTEKVRMYKEGVVPPQEKAELVSSILRLVSAMVAPQITPFMTPEEITTIVTSTLAAFNLSPQEVNTVLRMAIGNTGGDPSNPSGLTPPPLR